MEHRTAVNVGDEVQGYDALAGSDFLGEVTALSPGRICAAIADQLTGATRWVNLDFASEVIINFTAEAE